MSKTMKEHNQQVELDGIGFSMSPVEIRSAMARFYSFNKVVDFWETKARERCNNEQTIFSQMTEVATQRWSAHDEREDVVTAVESLAYQFWGKFI